MARKPKFEPMADEEYDSLIAELRRPKSDKEKRFIKLGWELMEAKFRYYVLIDTVLEDHQYDALEREYDALSKELNLPPTAVDMVGFNQFRPSSYLVSDKVLKMNPPKEPV